MFPHPARPAPPVLSNPKDLLHPAPCTPRPAPGTSHPAPGTTTMRIILATRNPGKVDELRAMLADLPVELVSAAEIAGAPEVEELAATIEGNASAKARALSVHTGLPALADDTALEVDALGGLPGVHSARFAGSGADDAANRALLLRQLEGSRDRRARFRTVLAFANQGALQLFEGVCEGQITTEARGAHGFGYDPVFQPDGAAQTFAEMPSAQKNAISHRRRALDAFTEYLRALL